jgi:hypothetical protein
MRGYDEWEADSLMEASRLAEERALLEMRRREMRAIANGHAARSLEPVVRDRTVLQSRPMTRRPALPI